MAKKKNNLAVHPQHLIMLLAGTALLGLLSIFMFASRAEGTRVPGHMGDRYDKDGNGYPDKGVQVNGHYTSLYAYDENGDWYWDLGDGRVQGTVASVEDLDQTTLTKCDYVVNYRGGFENDPFLDNGWIQNHINCKGFDDNGQYNYLIVHESDPRYKGNPDWAIWGNWEYHTLTVSKSGNLVRPDKPINN